MKNIGKTTENKFSKALIVGGVVLLIIAAYAVTAYMVKTWPFNNTVQTQASKTSTPSATQTQPAITTTESTGSNTNTPAQSTNTAKNPQTTVPISQTSGTGSITITASNQNGDTLQIRGLIAGIISSGTCSLILRKDSSVTITLSSGIQAQSSSSTCQGFDVSISREGMSSGTWHIALSFTSGTLQGSTSSQVVIQ